MLLYSIKDQEDGFTLIELSIVLIIIGLVVGGVLVGQDLIRASQIRATVSQIEKYNTAVHTFQSKYGGIPGDLLYTDAQAFGLYTITFAAYVGHPGYGDNNGIIQAGNGSGTTVQNKTVLNGEPLMFWRQLSDAKLVEGNYGSTINSAGEVAWNPAVANNCNDVSGQDVMNSYLPPAKLQTSTIEVNSPGDGQNYFLLTEIHCVSGAGSNGTSTNPLTAQESYKIDSKVDDGSPKSGNIFAIDGSQDLNGYLTWTRLSIITLCVNSNIYNVTQGVSPACSLRFKLQ